MNLSLNLNLKSIFSSPNEEKEEPERADCGIVTSQVADVYQKPNTDSKIVYHLKQGDQALVIGVTAVVKIMCI